MRPSLIIAALAVALSLNPARAQPATPNVEPVNAAAPASPLTLTDAFARAEAASPLLAVSQRETAVAIGQVMQAERLPNPELDVSVEDHRSATRTSTVSISMPIELGGKRAARVRSASLERDLAEQSLLDTRAQLRAAVIARFFDVAIAQERLRLAQSMQTIAERGAGMSRARVEAGRAAPLENSRAGVELANARIETQQASADLLAAQRSLAALWGDSAGVPSRVEADLSELPSLPGLEVLQTRLESSARLRSGLLQVELRQSQLDEASRARVPDMRVSVGVAKDREAGRNIPQVGVSIPLPFFDRNQGNLYSATQRVYQATDALRDLQTQLRVELSLAFSNAESADLAAREYRNVVLPGAQAAYDGARKGFEAGRLTLLDVLDAQRTLSQANASYLSQVATAHRARADLERLTGR